MRKSFKDEERRKRGIGDKVIVASEHSRLPRNFNDFLSNGDNKTQLAELVLKVILKDKIKILSLLTTDVIYVSMYNKCIKITVNGSTEVGHLSSNQEEADRKLMLHVSDALSADSVSKVVISSRSRDTNVLILSIELFIEEFLKRVIVD